MIRLTPKLSEAVQRRIDEIDTSGVGTWVLRHCRDELNALPLAGNQVYLWALRPDGTVLCLDHESFSLSAEEERDATTLYAMAVHAARRYPELGEMVPERPDGIEPCGSCDGRGFDAETGDGCSACSAVGWRRVSRPAPAPDPDPPAAQA